MRLITIVLLLLFALTSFGQVRHNQLRDLQTGSTDTLVYFQRNARGWEFVKDVLSQYDYWQLGIYGDNVETINSKERLTIKPGRSVTMSYDTGQDTIYLGLSDSIYIKKLLFESDTSIISFAGPDTTTAQNSVPVFRDDTIRWELMEGGISDAPSDGNLYGRKNASWSLADNYNSWGAENNGSNRKNIGSSQTLNFVEGNNMNVYWGTGNNLIFDWSEPSWYYDWNTTVSSLSGLNNDYLLMTNSNYDKKKISIENFGATIAAFFVFDAIADIPNRGVNGADKILKVTSANDGYEWVEYNSTNWNTAYSNYITGISVTGTDTKTITLTQQDGGTLSDSFTDLQGSGTSPWSTDAYGINYQGGNVGIGQTADASNKLYVLGNDFMAIGGKNTNTNSTSIGVYGRCDAGMGLSGFSSSKWGVHGKTDTGYAGYFEGRIYSTGNNNSAMIYGYNSSTDSNSYGVRGSGKIGVLGQSTTSEYGGWFDKTYSNDGYYTAGGIIADEGGFLRIKESVDSGAPNGSIYYSTDQNKLVYKDSSGTVHTLY